MIYFVDIEASSLDQGSFPIEIGWAGTDGSSESHLIRPSWRWTGWSAASERLHGISRAQLERDGEPLHEVARRAIDVLRPDLTVASDNAAFDQFWLDELLAVAGLSSTVRVVEAMRVYRSVAPESAIKTAIADELRRDRIRHRALPDAEAMLWVYRRLAAG